MKSAIIISSYPSSDYRLNILKQTLRSVKGNGFDVILTTNYPITDNEIYDMVDYIVWDKIDIQSVFDYDVRIDSPGWFFKNDNFEATIAFDNAYHFDLYRSIWNAVNLINGLNYDFFYYIEGDSILLKNNDLIKTRDLMFEKNKDILFCVGHSDGEFGGYDMYVTMIFGGIPKKFLDMFKNIPTDIEDWISNKNYYLNSMEVIFYRNVEDRNKIMDLDIKHFSESFDFNKLRKIDFLGLNALFFLDKNNMNDMYLFINNSYNEDKIYNDDIIWFDQILGPYSYFIQKVAMEGYMNKTVKEVVVKGNNEIVFSKKFDDNYLNKIKKSQHIKFLK